MRISTTLEVADENIPGTYTWDEAVKACSELGNGWRLPTKEELDLLYQHKDEIGGFGEGWLWSSSQNRYNFAWGRRFSVGCQVAYLKSYAGGVRAVRALTKEGGKMQGIAH